VTLSCQRHCRGTVQNLKKTKKNKQKTTEVPTVSRCGETTVILCSTITITNHCQTTTEKVVFRSRRNVVSDGAFLTDDGRLYHACAEAIRKARSPSVECLEVQELHSAASNGTSTAWPPHDAARQTLSVRLLSWWYVWPLVLCVVFTWLKRWRYLSYLRLSAVESELVPACRQSSSLVPGQYSNSSQVHHSAEAHLSLAEISTLTVHVKYALDFVSSFC